MELSKPSKLLIRMIGVAALLIIVIGTIYYRSFAALPFALGVLVLAGLNMLKVRMLERTVQKVTSMEPGEEETGKNIVRFRSLLRYFLTGIVLVAIGFIQNYTTEPPAGSTRTIYINIWAVLFPNGPESLLGEPFISIWGALAGLFTLQLSVFFVRSLKLEKDGDNFIKYEDDPEIPAEDSAASADIDNNKDIGDYEIGSNKKSDEKDTETNVDY